MIDDVTNELMYETLKELRADVLDVKKMRGEMHEGFASLKTYMASFLRDQSLLEGRVAELEANIDRIKTRLDLVD